MNKTKIEWCGSTWNPVTGCLHGCEYCYARGIARRFEGFYDSKLERNGKVIGGLYFVVDEPMYRQTKTGKMVKANYPYGFAPTFHRYRLSEPAKVKKPQNIFVCSMADLFGDWVPDEWIQAVFEACETAPWHRYMFLTKNPGRYFSLPAEHITYDNFWFGTTITGSEDRFPSSDKVNTFLSIEPLLCDICGIMDLTDINWVIIGAETGNRKGKVIPKREWIENIVTQCRAASTPLFMKNSLAPIWDGPLIQEYPWEAQQP